MQKFCKRCETSTQHLKALFGVLAYNIHFARASHTLYPKEQAVVDWFNKEKVNFPKSTKAFLLALVSNKLNFKLMC